MLKKFIEYIKNNKLFVFYLVIIFIINLILLNLPLTKEFSYEFAASNSLLLILVSGFYAIRRINQDQVLTRVSARKLVINNLVFLLFPIFIVCLGSFFNRICSYEQGLSFYLIITFPSIIIGTSLGFLVSIFSRKFRYIYFLLVVILIALLPAFDIYFYPQIYFYNPLIGYYPGTIYDEKIDISSRLIFYRIINIIFFGSILVVSFLRMKNKLAIKRRYIFSSLVFVTVLFSWTSVYFGFVTTPESLQKVLNKTLTTPNYVVHYSPELNDKNAKILLMYSELYYKELSEYFDFKPHNKITIYLFKDGEQKGKYFGSNTADVAKPWLNEIYITNESYSRTLKHELAHCFSASIAKGIFKVADNFNPALIEGIAMAADPIYGEEDLDYYAALAYSKGYKISLTDLFNGLKFFNQASSIGYVYAGSFSKFLIEKYGIDKFKKLYSDIDFISIYGKSIEQLEPDFYKKLKSIKLKDNEHKANYYFGRKSIFKKDCPRYLAERIDAGWEMYNAEMYSESEQIFNEVLQISNEYSALIGYINSLTKVDKDSIAANILEEEIKKYEGTAYYYNLELKLADIYGKSKRLEKADSLYVTLIRQNPISSLKNISIQRKLLLENKLLNLYLNSNDLTRFILLRDINKEKLYLPSLNSLIELSKILDENYSSFVRIIKPDIKVNSIEDVINIIALIDYMVANLDFENAKLLLKSVIEKNKNFAHEVKLRNSLKRVNELEILRAQLFE